MKCLIIQLCFAIANGIIVRFGSIGDRNLIGADFGRAKPSVKTLEVDYWTGDFCTVKPVNQINSVPKALFLQRGNCSFSNKASIAADAGYQAVIFVSNLVIPSIPGNSEDCPDIFVAMIDVDWSSIIVQSKGQFIEFVDAVNRNLWDVFIQRSIQNLDMKNLVTLRNCGVIHHSSRNETITSGISVIGARKAIAIARRLDSVQLQLQSHVLMEILLETIQRQGSIISWDELIVDIFSILFNWEFDLNILRQIQFEESLCALYVQLSLATLQRLPNLTNCVKRKLEPLLSDARWDGYLLWLIRDELSFIHSNVGTVALIDYVDFVAGNAWKPADILETSAAVSSLFGAKLQWNSSSVFLWRDFHGKISVFLDEIGLLAESKIHATIAMHLSSVLWLNFSNDLCSRYSIDDCSELGQWSNVCLFPRLIFATPPIFSGLDERNRHFDVMIKSAQSMMSRRESNSSHGSTLLVFMERAVTITPPSMMIGYDAPHAAPALLELYNKLFRYCIAENNYSTNVIMESSDIKDAGIIRLGVISSFLYDHSVGRLIIPIIEQLNRTKFDVIIVDSGSSRDWLNMELRSAVGNYLKFWEMQDKTKSIVNGVSMVRNLSLDLILFPEIGMDSLTLSIANFRMAPIQLVFWGHPISQHIPTIDYFISSELFEPEPTRRMSTDLRAEQTIILEGLSSIFIPPVVDSEAVDRSHVLHNYGISPSRRVYLLPHTIMKFSLEFDDVLTGVLAADNNSCLVILYSASQLLWMQSLRARLEAKSVHRSRIIFLPKFERKEYYTFLKCCADVILDSFPFGMGVTALEAFSLSVPIITYPRAQSVPALVYGMVKLIGLERELVADSVANYVQKAVFLAGRFETENSRTAWMKMKEKLANNSKILFSQHQGSSSLHDWETLLSKMAFNSRNASV